jgi:uncharacterized Zn finger protein
MRIGKTFNIQNEIFVTVYTKCCRCSKRFKVIIREAIAKKTLYHHELLECSTCGIYWDEIVGILDQAYRTTGVPVVHQYFRKWKRRR